ncbi:ATP-binding cassette sub-family A member 2-like [Glandiceps talaboti]
MGSITLKRLYDLEIPPKHQIKESNDHVSVESTQDDISIGMCIKDLVKLYRNGEVLAVNNLNLDLYEDQITVLLGHNGAGKTTLMSILTGFITPTSGTAIINGKDIQREMVQIRQSLGICPQYNALFDKLTVEEHLWFYSKIKGAKMEDFENETERILADIGLHNKKHSTIKTLSGGMKRKLSVAVAFTGGAKTVILDEPTAGVDPYSRRAIWDLLQKYKQGRTILLSTHHMDEASLLGDRIAILAKGQLKCCGSPQYLKTNFGFGYTLTLVKDKENLATGDRTNRSLTPAHIRPSVVTSFIQQYLPLAEFKSESDNELLYHVPVKATPKSHFIKLLEALSTHKRNLAISSYGMTETTLEQVYLKITFDDAPTPHLDNANYIPYDKPSNESNSQDVKEDSDMYEVPLITEHAERSQDAIRNKETQLPVTTTWTIFAGLLMKRLQYSRRDIKMFFLQLVLPVIFVASAVGLSVIALNLPKTPSLTFQSTMYKSDVTYVPYSDEMKYAPTENFPGDDIKDSTVDKLLDTLYYPAGLGATCLLSSPFNSTLDGLLHTNTGIELTSKDFNQMCQKTVPKSLKVTFPYGERDKQSNIPEGVCHCKADSTGMECSDDGNTTPVPEYRVISSEILQDVTGRNLTHYFMKTVREYNQTRYGALSFVRPRSPDIMEKLNPSSPFRRLQTKNAAVAWYNIDSKQSIPLYLNIINNAILRANVDPATQGNPSAYGITAINEPIHSERTLVFQFMRRGVSLQISNMMLCGASFIPASIIVFLVYERVTKAKHLHFISGVTPLVYWLANYVWDMLICLVPIFCCILCIHVSGVPVFSSPHNLSVIAALFIFYAWSVIPMMYPMAYLFDVPSSAFVIVLIFNLGVGMIPVVIMFFMRYILEGEIFVILSRVCHKIFILLPNYCFAYGLVEISYLDMMNTFYEQLGLYDKVQHPFVFLTDIFVVMAIEGFVFFGFAVLCEYRMDEWLYRKLGFGVFHKNTHSDGDEDEEVVDERKRILRGSDDDVLVLVNLTKIYNATKLREGKKTKMLLTAVNKVCLGVPQGQCFGLLGINGAGKTTLFQMLTGDKSITSGDAFVRGYSISRDIRKVYQHIGYCPQFDALYDKLTGREHLMLYAKLRGVPVGERQEVTLALCTLDPWFFFLDTDNFYVENSQSRCRNAK